MSNKEDEFDPEELFDEPTERVDDSANDKQDDEVTGNGPA